MRNAGARREERRRRGHRPARGVTLIELLIVIAIIAVMSAATLAVITAPLQEDVLSRMDAATEAGLASFFSALAQDAHTAATLEPVAEAPGLRLKGAGGEGGAADVVYFVDGHRRLRRAVVAAGSVPGSGPAGGADGRTGEGAAPAPGTALLEDVQELTAEPAAEGRLWKVRVRGGTERFGRPLVYDRQMILGVGLTSFAGGGQ